MNSHLHRRASMVLVLLLAIVMLAMQCIGLVHRVSHATIVHGGSTSMQSEFWHVVANSSEGAAQDQTLTSHQDSAKASDPLHSHHEAADCERFDALCAAHALVSAPADFRLPPPAVFAVSRVYLAVLSARTPRAHARAPPSA